jgi:uncharacterized membrane protein YqiK
MAQERHESHSARRSSGTGMGLVAIIIALIFIVGPFAAPVEIGGLAQTILVAFGVVLLTTGSIIVVITRLYRKTSANEAFVKTGMGGKKAIIDGGAIVIPVVHELVWVSLETMKLDIDRRSKDSMLTLDKLRADIRAEFFIRVNKTPEGVMQAATSLGARCSDPQAVMQLVEAKLVSALRVVAATMSLEDLNKKREEFATQVQNMVQKDIEHNGYQLETVTISHLDQAPPSALDPENNVFDAEGARRIAEITNAARVERNKLVALADKEVKEQDVQKDRALYELEVQRANAEATKNKQIATAAATATAEAAQVAAEQDRAAQLAGVARDQAVAVAEVSKNQALEVANQERQKAVQTAQIAREQATEVAARQKEIAIANAEKARADAEKDRLTSEKLKETESQAVLTVSVTAEADRNANVAVIAKRAAAEQTKIENNMAADVAAYSVKIQANAEREAAEARAAATVRQAEAAKSSKTLEAEGETAVQMVPVNVAAKHVEVEQARVGVVKAELAAKSEHAAISSELEKALATIMADKEARIAMANAMGQAFAAAKMTIWSDPTQLAQMMASFTGGQKVGQFMSGLDASTPTDIKLAALAGAEGIGKFGADLLKRLAGVEVSPEVVERVIKEEISKGKVVGA